MSCAAFEAPRLKRVYLHVTRGCNLRCRYCYFAAGEPMSAEWTTVGLLDALTDICSLAPDAIVFTGGEPLLRGDLFQTAAALQWLDPAHRIQRCLISNGQLVDPDSARRIAEVFDAVRISLDGPPGVNDPLRGAGSGRAAMRAIRRLRTAGMAPSVSVTVSAVTLPFLSACLEYILDEVGVPDIHVSAIRPVGRAAGPEFACAPTAVAAAAADFWRSRFGAPQELDKAAAATLAACSKCGVGSYLNILPDGSVYPCHVLSTAGYCLGNMRKVPLGTLLRTSDVLDRLVTLDAAALARESAEMREALEQAACWGEVLGRLRGATARVARAPCVPDPAGGSGIGSSPVQASPC